MKIIAAINKQACTLYSSYILNEHCHYAVHGYQQARIQQCVHSMHASAIVLSVLDLLQEGTVGYSKKFPTGHCMSYKRF